MDAETAALPKPVFSIFTASAIFTIVQALLTKIHRNLARYRNDIQTKGLYWSIVHRLYKIPTMRQLLTPLVNVLKPDHVNVGSHIVYIDKWDATVSQELLLSGKWEEYEIDLFKSHIKPGAVTHSFEKQRFVERDFEFASVKQVFLFFFLQKIQRRMLINITILFLKIINCPYQTLIEGNVIKFYPTNNI